MEIKLRIDAEEHAWAHLRRLSALIPLRTYTEPAVNYPRQVYVWIAVSERPYLLMVGIAALLITMSMTIPFSSVLFGAVLLRYDRWKEIVLASSLGSTTGGLLLFLVFYHLGWSQIVAAYPDLIKSTAWTDAIQWISAYGAVALFGIAALPLPQTPALIFTAILPVPASQVFLALFLGKLLKYGVYGWLAAKCPSWFQRLALNKNVQFVRRRIFRKHGAGPSMAVPVQGGIRKHFRDRTRRQTAGNLGQANYFSIG